MPKLLITGDTGLLGSSLAQEAGVIYEVFGVSRQITAPCLSWQHMFLDLTDSEATWRCLEKVRPDSIVHCAAMTDVERCEAQPEYAETVNVRAIEVLARWAARESAQFTFISTDSVFDGTSGGYNEQGTPRPLNHYARTKLAGENAAAGLCANSLIVRTNFYGWNRNGKPSLAKWMLSKLLRDEEVAAFTDVRFSPLFVNDLANAILELISRGANGVFHVGAKNSCSKYEFVLLLCKAFQFEPGRANPIRLEEFPFVAIRPRDTSLSVAKCTNFLGREMPDVAQGTAAFAKAMHQDGVAREKAPELVSKTAVGSR